MRVDFSEQAAGSPTTQRMLAGYFDELAERFGLQAPVVRVDAEELAPPHGRLLIVFVDGAPRGCGAVRTLEPGIGEIKRMWLHPAVRGHGLGRQLLDTLEKAARELGHREVRLDTSAYLNEAVTLYRTAGYREVESYNGNSDADHWFAKSLEPPPL